MRHDGSERFALKGEEPLAAQRGLPTARSSPVSAESTAVHHALSISALAELCQQEIQAYRRGEPSNEAYGLELLRRAIVLGDQGAWAGIQQCLSVIVVGWLHGHPSRTVACRWESEENYVVLAFERFWWATTQSQRVEFRTLAGALQYLRASLNGALLDTVRAYVRPKEVPLPGAGEPGEPYAEDGGEGDELWEAIRILLPDQREQRLAYLLFHCGLKPREIVHFCPREFSSAEDIYRLRRTIVERFLRHADSIRWRLNQQEQV